ncbi:MAG: hypothetical protein HFE86_06310 [Clostridiales bacterium]|nr:hypothetical protein [Clostridiales bacterium]
MPRPVRGIDGRPAAFLADRPAAGRAVPRRLSEKELASLEWKGICVLLVLAFVFYLLRLFASGWLAAAALLTDWLWVLVLPALMLLAVRFSFGRFTAACLLVYGGQTVLDAVFSLVSGLRTGGGVGVGSLLYVGLSGLLLPLLFIVLPGMGMQFLRMRWKGPAVLGAGALLLTAAALLLGQLLQIWIAASLYSGGGFGLSSALRYMWKNAAGDILQSGAVFLVFFLVDVFLRSGGLERLGRKQAA